MRNALLALLAKEPAHAYELKARLESEFGALWPTNDGQAYVLLGRLEAAGLVASREAPGSRRRKVYELTPAGHDHVQQWFADPSEPTPVRAELLTKLVLARQVGLADPLALIDRQRRAHLRALRDVERLAREVASGSTEALLVEGAALHLQADLRWLEVCERHFEKPVATA